MNPFLKRLETGLVASSWYKRFAVCLAGLPSELLPSDQSLNSCRYCEHGVSSGQRNVTYIFNYAPVATKADERFYATVVESRHDQAIAIFSSICKFVDGAKLSSWDSCANELVNFFRGKDLSNCGIVKLSS